MHNHDPKIVNQLLVEAFNKTCLTLLGAPIIYFTIFSKFKSFDNLQGYTIALAMSKVRMLINLMQMYLSNQPYDSVKFYFHSFIHSQFML